MNVTRINSETQQACIIYYEGSEIKRYSFYDDYAYTKTSRKMAEFRKMSLKDFKEIHPEFFL